MIELDPAGDGRGAGRILGFLRACAAEIGG